MEMNWKERLQGGWVDFFQYRSGSRKSQETSNYSEWKPRLGPSATARQPSQLQQQVYSNYSFQYVQLCSMVRFLACTAIVVAVGADVADTVAVAVSRSVAVRYNCLYLSP